VKGDTLEALGHRFTVAELDGRRIARVLLTALQPAETGEGDDDVPDEPDRSGRAANAITPGATTQSES
jgi:hypothetical protein